MKHTSTIYLVSYALVLSTLSCTANRLQLDAPSVASSSSIAADFFDAIRNNDTARVTNLLGQDSRLLERIVARDNGQGVMQERTPLMYAAQLGHQAMVQYLVEHGAQVDQANNDDSSPLMIAAHQGHQEVVQYLVEHGAQVNQANNDGSSPLMIAAHQDHQEVVQYLVKHGTDIEFVQAIREGNLEKVQKAVAEEGVDINAFYSTGSGERFTPLQIAALNGQKPIVEFLVSHDNDSIDKRTEQGNFTALHLAAKKNQKDVVSTLIESGADKNAKDDAGMTPLHIAAQKGFSRTVKVLTGQGVDINIPNGERVTAVYLAHQGGHQKIQDYLLARGARLETTGRRNDDGTTGTGRRNDDGTTGAGRRNDDGTTGTGRRNDDGTTGTGRRNDDGTSSICKSNEEKLGKAIKDGDLKKVQSIMSENHTDYLNEKIPVKKSGDGKAYFTPLQIGAAWGKYDIVKYLLANYRDELDIDAKTKGDGSTALHLAAGCNYDKVAEILIDNGANKAIQNIVGTPLHIAVISKSTRVVKCLIEKGVNTTIKNRDGKTALELAKQKGHTEIIGLIELYELESELERRHTSINPKDFERIKSTFKQADYRASSSVNGQGYSLLYHAAKEGWKEAVKFLVEKAEEDDLNKAIQGSTYSPLCIAVQKGNTEIVKLLIYGRVESHHRMVANQEEEIEREAVTCIEATVESLRDQEGRTLLHMAAAKGYEQIVRLLVEFMAIAAEQYENSQATPLYQGYVMRELVYVSRKDSNANTAESLARDAHFTTIADFLKKVREDIEKRRIDLGSDAYVASTCGGGITTGILSCIRGSLGVLGIQCNIGCQTQSWEHKRKELVITTRKIWRDKDERLWKGMIQQLD